MMIPLTTNESDHTRNLASDSYISIKSVIREVNM
jgi:hypothetical protein